MACHVKWTISASAFFIKVKVVQNSKSNSGMQVDRQKAKIAGWGVLFVAGDPNTPNNNSTCATTEGGPLDYRLQPCDMESVEVTACTVLYLDICMQIHIYKYLFLK